MPDTETPALVQNIREWLVKLRDVDPREWDGVSVALLESAAETIARLSREKDERQRQLKESNHG
jgi:hypothetical protein